MIIFTMKNIKFFVVALFALICATSCEQDNEGSIYTPVAQNISFETKQVSVLTAEDSYNTQILLTRNVTKGAYTATVQLVSDENVFTLGNNGAVEFADGQASAYLEVSATSLQKGKTYVAKLELSAKDIAESDTILGNAISSSVYSLACDYNWIPAGSGTFYDGDMTELTVPVDIINGEGSNVYRIVAPFTAIALEADGASISGADIEFTVNNGKFELAPGQYPYDNDGYYSPYTIYYDPEGWANYCSIYQEENVVAINHLIAESGEPTYIGLFTFTWTEGSVLK